MRKITPNSSIRSKTSIRQNLKIFTLMFLLFVGVSSQQIWAQSIPGTGTSADICGNCTPTGWGDADPMLDGTPDISNRNQAGGEGTIGAGDTWTAAPLPLPPTGDVRWITLRDVGTQGSIEENVTTTMTGLTVGVTYKLVINTMTSITNGVGGTGGNETYAGVLIEDIDVQVGSNPRRTLVIPASSENVWGTNTIIFIASATSETFTVFPGADSGAGTNITFVEMVHLSVDGVSALVVLDTDGDGIGDTTDIDDDNDGILDVTESGGNDPNGDEDGDGIPNYLDVNDDGTGDGSTTDYTDANADGFPDAFDFDGDGVPNHLDLDSDNDGILDNVEFQTTAGYTAPSGSVGANGYYDIYETAVDSGTAANAPTNTDGTFGADYLDIDSDNDGIPDNVEAQSTTGYTTPTGNVGENGVDSAYENVDTYTPTGITIEDTDVDSIPDYRDSDSDNDGTSDLNENGEGNVVSGSDTDGDGLDNNFDADNSNYDVNDNINTPASDLPDIDGDVNTGGDVDYRDGVTGTDTDGDGIADVDDFDDDNDGIMDNRELCNASPGAAFTGLDITIEFNFDDFPGEVSWSLTGPTGATGLPTNVTYSAGTFTDSQVYNATVEGTYVLSVTDSYGDGMAETGFGNDNDALAFFRVLVDGVEVYNTTSVFGNYPNYGSSVDTGGSIVVAGNVFTCLNADPSGDADNDGTPNYQDADFVTGIGGDTLNANGTWSSLDHDGDGVPDHLDLDSDNDGITDNLEAQTTAGYVAPSGVDTDDDGVDDAYDPDCTPCGGVTGVEIVPTNSDTDAQPDYKDIDTDDDGIPDNIEAQTTTGYSAPNGVPGDNGLDSAYDFTDLYSSTGLNTSLVNTDGDAEPDFRDTDSDADGTPDIQENGDTDNAVSGTDTDGDGLDDNFEGSSTNDVDPNDEINDPTTDLPDGDLDVNSGGDVDYRDDLAGQDTDGDGIVDTVDIDDDNDGILDTDEQGSGSCNITYEFTGTIDGDRDRGSPNDLDKDFVFGDNYAFRITFDTTTPLIIQTTIGDQLNGRSGTVTVDGVSESISVSAASFQTVSHSPSPATSYDITIVGFDMSLTRIEITDLNGNTIANFDFGTSSSTVEPGYIGVNAATTQTTTTYSCFRDTDADGIPDYLDQDSDNDGILDVIEAQTSSGYVAPTGSVGANGLYDIYENNDTSAATGLTPINTDSGTESVTLPDYLDIDSDNDGIPDNVEAQTTAGYVAPSGTVGLNGVDSAYENNDTFTATGLTPNNHDGTDEPDYRDTDSDNDTTLDENESGITANGGGTADADGDGLLDTWEGSDATAGEAFDVNDEINDPVNNLLDADGDGSTTGDVDYRDDVIFIDSDDDGIQDSVDLDDDNDGILDTVESDGIDPSADADSDGTPNYLDADNNGGGTLGDANMDGVQDIFDADDDGVANHLDIDADNDGIPDNIEAQPTSSYIAPSGSGSGITDANMDGVDDNYAGGLTPENTDTTTGNMADSLPDYLDTDTDGDGILDINENGNANAVTGTDTDGDGLDDAFEGVLNDNDVNDDIDDPTTDLPDLDSDVNTADGSQPNAAEYNDVDYRDIDDDRTLPSVSGNILWLRADIGVSGVATVTGWTDQSSSALNATNTGNAPAKLGDGTATDGLNFNPTISFTEASSQDLEITGGGVLGNGTIYNDLWVYAVTASNSATNASHAFSNAVTGGNVEFEVPTTGSLFSYDTSVGTTPTAAWGGTAGSFNLWNAGSSTGTSTPSTTNKALYRDGLLIGSNSVATATFTSNNSSSFIGSDASGANFFDGQIAEIMVFNTAPTSAEQQIIQSYLAVKYGITLDQTDNDATIEEGDYVLEGGSIVWNESDNSTYHNDVAGIGRDDDKFLDQRQSRSINSTAEVTIGLGQIAANNGTNSNSFSSDGDFLMWGHNGIAINGSNTSAVTLLCESELQLDRVWKVVETGSVGSVEVAISESVLNGVLTSASTEVRVFKVADDPSFTTNVKHIPLTTTRDINGTTSYVVDYDFNGTKYFTYTEVLGIFWNGDLNAWTGGSGTSNAPATDDINSALDGSKVLVIDAETSGTNAIMTQSANVECLWVKSNSKLVVSSDLFIEFNQDFILDGEIRLIDDAQLVQSHTGLSNVQGSGVIYRDQAATVPNVYRYHYWSSPVTVALGNTTYSASTVMFDGTTPTSENSTTQAITWKDRTTDVTTLNGETTNPITIATWWIYSYFNGTSRDDWVQKFEDGAVNVAEGFIMKSTGRSPQNFTFMGSPNDGTYTKTLTPGASSLLGNPYPSVINTTNFITDNDGVIDGTLYFWEHQGEATTDSQVEGHGEFGYVGGYSQRNQAMGVAANSVVDGTSGLGEGTYNSPPQFIAVGQGFFVTATAGGTLSFENSQRSASTDNIFFRNNDPIANLPKLKIGMDYIDNGARYDPDTGDLEYQDNFENSPVHRQLGINFKAGNTFDYESGFDSQFFDLQPTDMYWDFENVDSNLIIAGVGAITADLQVPLGFDIQSDDPIAVMIDEMENMDGYSVYLGDLVTGVLYNLEDPVQLNLPKGSYTDRFVLMFGGEALSADDIPFLADFNVYMNNTTDQIMIRNNNNSFIEKVELFNILGQRVKVWNDIDNSNTLQQLDVFAPSAIYVVKVTTEKGEITKKVFID